MSAPRAQLLFSKPSPCDPGEVLRQKRKEQERQAYGGAQGGPMMRGTDIS